MSLAGRVLEESGAAQPPRFDAHKARADFPALAQQVHGKPLAWLDNGATAQKPQVVIDRVSHFYEFENANTHSGGNTMAEAVSAAYEGARSRVAAFLGAASAQEIVFVRGATEGLNMLAELFVDILRPGDEILLTAAEHHANIVPWQFAAKKSGAAIRIVPVDDNGDLILEEYERLLGPRTRIASFTQISNALGTVLPIREMTAMAKHVGATVIVDGAQGVPHRRVDVQAIGCDFYLFSGHKLFAPTGIGAVWGRKQLWEQLPPWQTGGGMIERVTFETTSFLAPPKRFEAGTYSLAGAIGLGAAIDYLNGIGLDAIEQYEAELLAYALDGLQDINGLRVIGRPKDRGGVISFVMDAIPDRDIAKALDTEGIAVRVGHHCAQPIMARFGVESTVRPSFAFYNTIAEVDALVAALRAFNTASA